MAHGKEPEGADDCEAWREEAMNIKTNGLTYFWAERDRTWNTGCLVWCGKASCMASAPCTAEKTA